MTPNRSQPFPPSLWHATAIPVAPSPALTESVTTDVLVIGAGFTGLSTALHLAELGVQAYVIEASQPGWGASGRNGGQVIPGLKYDPQELISRFGPEHGKALVDFAGSAADAVFELINRHGIACDPVRKGWIQTAHSDAMLKSVETRARQWMDQGAPVELLDSAEVSRRLGTSGFRGGWIDYRAGSVQPLSYARGLLMACRLAGVKVYGDSAATNLQRDGDGWRVTLATGATVRASRVVLATNGYTDNLWPGLKQTVLPAQSFLVATAPLPASVGDAILPNGEVSSDSRRLLVYFRRDAQGRFVLGGRGPFHDPSSVTDWKHVEHAMCLMFPQLKGVPIDYRWAGRVAVTADFLPHLHEPEPGIVMALGYNGRGVAMATAMGRALASYLTGNDNALPLPFTPVKPIPFHGLQRFYMAAGVAWYRFLDSLS